MSKANELRILYGKIELDSTEERLLLSSVKNGNASQDEIDELIDIVKANPNGGKILDEIKDFENSLVTEMKQLLNELNELEEECNDVAHIEDESEQEKRNKDIKKRYKKNVAKSEEIIDAMKISYFQIQDFTQFEDELYNLKDSLAHLE